MHKVYLNANNADNKFYADNIFIDFSIFDINEEK